MGVLLYFLYSFFFFPVWEKESLGNTEIIQKWKMQTRFDWVPENLKTSLATQSQLTINVYIRVVFEFNALIRRFLCWDAMFFNILLRFILSDTLSTV